MQTALLLLFGFFGQNIACVATSADNLGGVFALTADGVLNGSAISSDTGIICTPDNTAGHDYARGVIGAFYYISTTNGSNDIVTDACGQVVQRFYYEPYGRLNRELSDYDPDGDHVMYAGNFRFTGQEYDAESGLYNYNARMYDAVTGRFLSPDPVHTDRPGMDSYDRYQYAAANPVNFVDLDGQKPKIANLFGSGPGCGGRGALIYQNYWGPGNCSPELANRLTKLVLQPHFIDKY